LFSLGEKLGIDRFDDLAAATLADSPSDPPVHWRAAGNAAWQWYERETLIGGRWTLTGITTPVNRDTGETYTEQKGYLDEHLVPVDMRVWDPDDDEKEPSPPPTESGRHLPSLKRKARHGRPPSKWLRNLRADELHIWLATLDVPEAGVEGMTFWEHLTRDHFFEADKIAGLSEADLALLHAAAHAGY
jgi:hypothetical protein